MTNYVHPTQKSMSQKGPTDEVALFEDLVMVDLHTLSAGVTEEYKNFVISNINDHCLRMAVMKGEYRWHQHESSDECFLTLEGCLEIDLCDGRTIKLLPGQSFKIPAGTVHRTRAASRTVNLCFERLTAYTDVKFESSGELCPSIIVAYPCDTMRLVHALVGALRKIDGPISLCHKPACHFVQEIWC